MVHEKAIYILEGRTYYVEKYDHKERRAEVREAEVDYYTDAITYTKVRILDRFAEEARGNGRRNHGEVHVRRRWSASRRSSSTRTRTSGAGELTMPENEMHTTAYWLTVPRELMRALPFSLEERRDGVVALSYTLGQLAALFLMCDRHDLASRSATTARARRASSAGCCGSGWARAGGGTSPAGRRLRAERLRLRRLPGRHRALRAAVPAPRPPARREPQADRRLPLQRRLPLLRRACRRGRQQGQGSGSGDSRRRPGAGRESARARGPLVQAEFHR